MNRIGHNQMFSMFSKHLLSILEVAYCKYCSGNLIFWFTKWTNIIETKVKNSTFTGSNIFTVVSLKCPISILLNYTNLLYSVTSDCNVVHNYVAFIDVIFD